MAVKSISDLAPTHMQPLSGDHILPLRAKHGPERNGRCPRFSAWATGFTAMNYQAQSWSEEGSIFHPWFMFFFHKTGFQPPWFKTCVPGFYIIVLYYYIDIYIYCILLYIILLYYPCFMVRGPHQQTYLCLRLNYGHLALMECLWFTLVDHHVPQYLIAIVGKSPMFKPTHIIYIYVYMCIYIYNRHINCWSCIPTASHSPLMEALYECSIQKSHW